MSEDTRYCYGIGCTWHGPIQHTIPRPKFKDYNPPCCPYCGGLLFELDSKKEWDEGVEKFTKKNPEFPLYPQFIEQLNQYGCKSFQDWNFKKEYAKFVEGLEKKSE